MPGSLGYEQKDADTFASWVFLEKKNFSILFLQCNKELLILLSNLNAGCRLFEI
jgi:hypothetical protein